jgi:hypothetical protein
MPTQEERLRILRMVQAGKLTAEEAVQLLETLGEPRLPGRGRPPAAQTSAKPRWFRMRVTDKITGKTHVDIRLPVHVVTAGAKLGARFSPEAVGLDMNKVIENIRKGIIGKVLETDTPDKEEKVEVFIE